MIARGSSIVLASHNAGKLREISALLEPFEVSCRSAADFGLAEPNETETTFAGNARIKAHFAARETGLPALSDDSGLTVDALDGDPGVYTADWAETPNGRDYQMAMTKVHDALIAKKTPTPWTAQFNCTLCLAMPDGTDQIFAGSAAGQLVWPFRGDKGFGFDPMFIHDGLTQTYAEIEPDHKHSINHRADAFAKFVKACFG